MLGLLLRCRLKQLKSFPGRRGLVDGSIVPYTERRLCFRVRAHTQVASSIPGLGHLGEAADLCSSFTWVFLSLTLSPFLSLKVNKKNKQVLVEI